MGKKKRQTKLSEPEIEQPPSAHELEQDKPPKKSKKDKGYYSEPQESSKSYGDDRKKSRKGSKKDHPPSYMSIQQLQKYPQYSWEEIGKHDHREDAWVVIDNSIYDVSKFINKHPGGADVIIQRAGKQASKTFKQAKHPFHSLEQTLPKYFVGRVKVDSLIEDWQKEVKTGQMDLFCTIVLSISLSGFILYMSL